MTTWNRTTNFPHTARRKSAIDEIIAGAADVEDGETGVNRCIDLYCSEMGITDDALIDLAKYEAFKRGALDAGIPLSVVEGKSRLSDHYSQEHIDEQCGRKRDE